MLRNVKCARGMIHGWIPLEAPEISYGDSWTLPLIAIMTSSGMKKSERTKNARERKRDGSSGDLIQRSVSTEAARGVGAILIIAIAGFLILASVGSGGAAGAFL